MLGRANKDPWWHSCAVQYLAADELLYGAVHLNNVIANGERAEAACITNACNRGAKNEGGRVAGQSGQGIEREMRQHCTCTTPTHTKRWEARWAMRQMRRGGEVHRTGARYEMQGNSGEASLARAVTGGGGCYTPNTLLSVRRLSSDTACNA